ncbi:MAG: matrixin family metalloprotease [Planctomycetota bacterium]
MGTRSGIFGILLQTPVSTIVLALCMLTGTYTVCSADLIESDEYYAPGAEFTDDDHLHSADFSFGPTVNPGKWGGTPLGSPGGVVTWSLASTPYQSTTFSQQVIPPATFLPPGYKQEIEAAFAAWSSVADITFVEVPDSNSAFNAPGATGDIRIGGHEFDGPGGTLARAFFPPANGGTAAGDIHLDVSEDWKIGFGGPGFDIFQVMAHEIGHSIGLGHSDVEPALMDPIYTEAFRGLQPDDINGAMALYGPVAAAAAIPEPGSFTMLSLVLLAGLGIRRYRVAGVSSTLQSGHNA